MGSAVSLTGGDSAQIDGTNITDLADGVPFEITFPESYGTVKRGKDGNMIYAKNEMGKVADVVLRILMGGSTDKFLLARLQQWDNPSTFKLMTAQFIKHVGDGAGNTQSKVYQCSGGIFKRQVDARTSSNDDSEQSVAVYRLQFGDVSTSIQ